MKDKKNNPLRTIVLTYGFVLLGGVLPAVQNGPDVLAKLALDPATAKESVLDSLTSGSVYNYAAIEAFKSLPPASRAAIVRAGLDWIKTYAGTAEFKAAYQAWREEKKPEAPAARPAADDVMKKQRADFEKQVADMRKSMANLDAATKETLEKNIKEMRAQMEAMEKDPEQKKLMGQMAELQRSEDKKKYDEQLADWSVTFPSDLRLLLKKRITDFLAASAGVDYAAKLVPSGDRMVFAREDYERKPPEWKICFRAGREATEAARAFAKDWLTELEGK
jgi:hypothetical protein